MGVASEADIQAAIFDALVYDGWLVYRSNQGGMKVDGRYVRFGYWQALGYELSDKGVADLIAFKPYVQPLVVEVKKPGGVLSEAQAIFLRAAMEARCRVVVAESLEDMAPYLERVEVQ